ncbi:class I SAM-dependent methyltransferase [Octadecabacter sp. 1_MG-2023]|uniref:O-methyltransferase n=1 Tax=unclassified Octadecabacter TaxID=196158 RepID=UPI001C07FA09|nr:MULTISPECIES: class I SAM-dependent methyltransferase [unclassified Octadecabacter]MBU2992198.1 class I SAM-dependent methyltransferase [Octadecabacter sp. B2R22]MDO6735046.1 class I SAM-dependent methyltransferase [Octadecabacter sp. 1_MG-2023]
MGFEIRTVREEPSSTMAGLFSAYAAMKPTFDAKMADLFESIEDGIAKTNDLGKLPLWADYKKLKDYGRPIGDNPKRKMADVRTKADYCQFYAWLADVLQPEAILEFGAAFGASGMYWLAGLGQRQSGTLYSFEPNPVWHPIAEQNFNAISDRHLLTLGTFEDNLDVIKPKVQISLIDAIHTRSFVDKQFELVRSVSAPGALVLFDDIHFSPDMKECWQHHARNPEFPGVWTLGSRVGVVELPKD